MQNQRSSIGRRENGGHCVIKNFYGLYLLKTLLQYLKKAVNKYGISAPGYIYVFIEF
jgi:hypothetical protein